MKVFSPGRAKRCAGLLLAAFVLFAFGGIGHAGDADNAGHGVKLEKIDSGIVNSTCCSVKSLVANSDRSRIYAANLEAMTVYEFDRASRKVLRVVAFVPSPGEGYDYDTHQWFAGSSQEKPVEMCFSHKDRYLWISLHNAGGVVVWDLSGVDTYVAGRPYKEAWLTDNSGPKPVKKKIRLLWIKTGVTPKVIAGSPDGRYLFVSNWHSNSVSVLSIDSPYPAKWVKIRDIAPVRIPRGLLVSPDSKYLYIAKMGGDSIVVIDLADFEEVSSIEVGVNPRHLIFDNGFGYCSINISSRFEKLDLAAGKVLKSVPTAESPRTIAASPDGRIIFVTCYRGDALQAYDAKSLALLGSWDCSGHPVAITVVQDKDVIEAWVGEERAGTVKVYRFKEESM